MTSRNTVWRSIYRLFPDPDASLIAGILLGVQTGIPNEVQEAFRLTGTSHIIVISGFNITIIAGLFTFLFSRRVGEAQGCVASSCRDYFLYPVGGCRTRRLFGQLSWVF